MQCSRSVLQILPLGIGLLLLIQVFSFYYNQNTHVNLTPKNVRIVRNDCSNCTAQQFNIAECGRTKRCVFGGCSNQNQPGTCHYMFAVASDTEKPADSVQMELYTKRNSPEVRYIAVGFSHDQVMGDDSVTYCVLNGNQQMEAHLSMNPPADKTNTPGVPGAEEGYLELLEGSANDDSIYCKVRQHSKPSAAGQQKDLIKPDLQRPFHLLLAKGPAAEPRVISIHGLDPTNAAEFPFVSPQPLLVLDPKLASQPGDQQQNGQKQQQTNGNNGQGNGNGGAGGGLTLVDAHGILMVIAWLGMTTVAIYSARYMRNAWPHTTVMGLKIWFHIHRTLNFLSVLLIVTSIAFILLNKQRWTGPWFGRSSIDLGGWHSLAGAIAVFLAFTQPFGALLRCGVDDPKRPRFNWIHRSIGLLALLLSQVSMFIAIYKFKKHFALPIFAQCLLILFFVVTVIIIVISEVLRVMELKEQRMNNMEMQTRGRGTTPSDAYYYHTQKSVSSKLVRMRKTLFIVVASICAGTAALLVLLILFQ